MAAPLIPYSVSSPTVIFTNAARRAVAKTWPDGSLGFLRQSDGTYRSWGAGINQEPGASILGSIRTIGSLDAPASGGSLANVTSNLPAKYQYIGGGGCLLNNPNDGSLLDFAHVERWPNGDGTKYWSALVLCRSTDNGDTWAYVADVIQLALPYVTDGSLLTPGYDIGGGGAIRVGAYVYLYYREMTAYTVTGASQYISVARCLASDLFASSITGSAGTWAKWSGSGLWTGNPLTGTGEKLFDLPLKFAYWPNCQTQSSSGLMLMTVNGDTVEGEDRQVFLVQSKDGINWKVPGSSDFTGLYNINYGTVQFKDNVSDRSGDGIGYLYTMEFTDMTTNSVINRRSVTLTTGSRRTRLNGFRGGPAGSIIR